MSKRRLLVPILTVAALAAATATLAFTTYAPSLTGRWLLAFGILLVVGIPSTSLAFRVTDKGTTTDVNYLVELGAVLLLGAPGAIAIAFIVAFVSQRLVQKKPWSKVVFNTSQVTLAAGAAGILYTVLGGNPTLAQTNYHFLSSLLPFMAAAISYFLVNSLAIALIIAVSERQKFANVWRQIVGAKILVDIVTSPLAFLIPWLFFWNVAAMLLAILPIVGLRYSYGINIELQQLNRDLLRALIKTLEAQDPYTSGHSTRVAERARQIALELGLSSRKVRLIETAALLHDIGKIGTEFSRILRQKGPLTPRQRELIRSHPDRGVEIIEPIRRLDPVILDCVRHHHERMDGTGYPSGLPGKEIPLGARVIMVADTIDAMLTARPYRDALPVEVVKEELRRHSGTQFDMRIVEAALRAGVVRTMESEVPMDVSSSPGEELEAEVPSSAHPRPRRMGVGGS